VGERRGRVLTIGGKFIEEQKINTTRNANEKVTGRGEE